jgi:DNA-binding HxlR family transcriptional regulator
MDYKFRCKCPITSAIDILGDKWILVIIKQMLIEDCMTFKDFIESDEAIATNILSSKLKCLEELGIIIKKQLPDNKKTNLYLLTEKGLALTPIIVELSIWSDENIRELNQIMRDSPEIAVMKSDKNAFIKMIQDTYKAKTEKFY